MTNYNLNGTYILKQKYIFGLFYTHTSDYFAQTPYQANRPTGIDIQKYQLELYAYDRCECHSAAQHGKLV